MSKKQAAIAKAVPAKQEGQPLVWKEEERKDHEPWLMSGVFSADEGELLRGFKGLMFRLYTKEMVLTQGGFTVVRYRLRYIDNPNRIFTAGRFVLSNPYMSAVALHYVCRLANDPAPASWTDATPFMQKFQEAGVLPGIERFFRESLEPTSPERSIDEESTTQ